MMGGSSLIFAAKTHTPGPPRACAWGVFKNPENQRGGAGWVPSPRAAVDGVTRTDRIARLSPESRPGPSGLAQAVTPR